MNTEAAPTKHRAPQSMEVAMNPDALLTIETVCALTGLAKSTIREMVRGVRFPAPVRMNPKVVRWRARDVHAFISSLS